MTLKQIAAALLFEYTKPPPRHDASVTANGRSEYRSCFRTTPKNPTFTGCLYVLCPR